MNHPYLLLSIVWLAVLVLAWRIWSRAQVKRLTSDRLRVDPPPPDSAGRPDSLTRWLFVAGFRQPEARRRFLVTTGVLFVLGISLALWFGSRGYIELGVRSLEKLPGSIGYLGLPILYAGPWLAATLLTAMPFVVVRARRHKRVEQIEQDLPVTLELLATLGEAGLGFDAALARVLESQRGTRPLAEELRGLQADIIGSRPRVECFRRLARRIELPTFNIFVSAVVQAEQVGAGVAAALRRQADDLRARRREDAMAMAMALPIKRLFPMVICFMPGVFVVTLGPAFFEFLKFADSFMRNR